jgi:hypothetical protein
VVEGENGEKRAVDVRPKKAIELVSAIASGKEVASDTVSRTGWVSLRT